MKRNGILLSLLPVMFAVVLGCNSNTTNPVAESGNNGKDSARLEDSALFRTVQQQYFQYFWDGAEPNSGMARERFHVDNVYPENDKHIVTSGGAGFGVMAILVGIERKFITREEGREHLRKIVSFLEKADRFHGAWPHWLDGETGSVKPFSRDDNGGDLVETCYMLQGLLCVRQYFKDGNEAEKKLAADIDKLWQEVDFQWYRNGQNVLYWHWSPDKGWKMNFPVKGYNECLILYIMGASSPTHGVPAEVYHEGWARGGQITADSVRDFGYSLDLDHIKMKNGGPLFWSQYSYLGLDPREIGRAHV